MNDNLRTEPADAGLTRCYLDLLAADTVKMSKMQDEIKRLKATRSVNSILSVTGRYYAAKCDHCGWVGSSEFCIESACGCVGDCEVLCPFCNRHIGDDKPAVKDISKFLNQTVVEKSERRDKLIEQMRNVIENQICNSCTTMRCGICGVRAALAAEGGE